MAHDGRRRKLTVRAGHFRVDDWARMVVRSLVRKRRSCRIYEINFEAERWIEKYII